jgi:hypothetical protein
MLRPLYLLGNGPCYPLDRRLGVGPRTGLDDVETKKCFAPTGIQPLIPYNQFIFVLNYCYLMLK